MDPSDFLLFLLIFVPVIFLIRYMYVRLKPRFRFGLHYALFALCALAALLIYFLILANVSDLFMSESNGPGTMQRSFVMYTFIGTMLSMALLVPAAAVTLVFLIVWLVKRGRLKMED